MPRMHRGVPLQPLSVVCALAPVSAVLTLEGLSAPFAVFPSVVPPSGLIPMCQVSVLRYQFRVGQYQV